jgi:hypothetical protein
MTVPTRTSIVLFDSAVTAGSTTKATAAVGANPAAGNGGWIDISGFSGGTIGWSVTNGASAPSTALQFTVQYSSVNNVAKATFDRWSGAGDVAPNGFTSGLIPVPAEAKFARVLAYGNQTNQANLYVEALLKG